jgi:hypothetical protein
MSGALPPLAIRLCGMRRDHFYLYCTYDLKYITFVWYDPKLSRCHHFAVVDLKTFLHALYLEIYRVYLDTCFNVPSTFRTKVKGNIYTATMLLWYVLQKGALTGVAFSLQGPLGLWITCGYYLSHLTRSSIRYLLVTGCRTLKGRRWDNLQWHTLDSKFNEIGRLFENQRSAQWHCQYGVPVDHCS